MELTLNVVADVVMDDEALDKMLKSMSIPELEALGKLIDDTLFLKRIQDTSFLSH